MPCSRSVLLTSTQLTGQNEIHPISIKPQQHSTTTLALTLIVCAQLLPQALHFRIAILFGDLPAQRQRGRLVVLRLVLVLRIANLANQSVLVVIGEADLRAYDHHQLRHGLGVVH